MPLLDPECYTEERRRELFPWLYLPKPSATTNAVPPQPPTGVAAAVQPGTAAAGRVTDAVTASGVTARMVAVVNPPAGGAERTFRIWKTTTIGSRSSIEEYRQALNQPGFRYDSWARDIIEKTPIATEPQEVDLVLVSVAELGFTGLTRYDIICRRAKEMGLQFCPAEVGLALRLSYTEQPMDEGLTAAMDPLADSDGRPSVCELARHDDGLWLNDAWVGPGRVWHPGSALVRVPSPQV